MEQPPSGRSRQPTTPGVRFRQLLGASEDSDDVTDWTVMQVVDAPLPRKRRVSRQRPSQYTCANCALVFRARQSGPAEPYCSLRCKDEAKAVRYARARLAEYGTCRVAELPEDIQDAIQMKIAHALAGGYDEQARRLAPALRQAIFDRDGSRCVICGAPGTEIDHAHGPSAEPENLRVLCPDCHKAVTRNRFVRVEDGSREARKSRQLWLRTLAPHPIRPCDVDDWASIWREWATGHSQ
jgi:5-methylcytosine-specific restriction endonuclease McrA